MVGADQVYKKAIGLNYVLIEDMKILKIRDLKLEVQCSHDALLMYGRYCKISRECS